ARSSLPRVADNPGDGLRNDGPVRRSRIDHVEVIRTLELEQTHVVAGPQGSRGERSRLLDRHPVVVGTVDEKAGDTEWETSPGVGASVAVVETGRGAADELRHGIVPEPAVGPRREVGDAGDRHDGVHEPLGGEEEREGAGGGWRDAERAGEVERSGDGSE